TGQGEKALLVSAVRPERRVHRVRDQRRLHDVALHRLEQAAGAQRAREGRRRQVVGRWLQRVEAALALAAVVADQDFALRIETEAGGLKPGVGQLLVPEHPLAVVADGPDLAGRVV